VIKARFLGLRAVNGRADGFTVVRAFARLAFLPLFLRPAVFFFAAALVLGVDFVFTALDFARAFDVDPTFAFALALVDAFTRGLDRDTVFFLAFVDGLDFAFVLNFTTAFFFDADFATDLVIAAALVLPRVVVFALVLLAEPRFAPALFFVLRPAVEVAALRFGFGFAAAEADAVLPALDRVPPAIAARAAASLATGTLNGLHET